MMSKVADSIRRGLKEAVAYTEGKADKRAYRIPYGQNMETAGGTESYPTGG